MDANENILDTRKKIVGIDARMIEMSGIGTYIQHLMGHGIYDYAVGKENEIRKYDQEVKIIPFDAPVYSVKEQLLYPNRAIKEANIQIMHFPHYNVPVSYKGHYIVTVHDLTHIVFPEFLGNKIKYYYAKFLMQHAINCSEHIFTVSYYSKHDIMRYFGTAEAKISITYDAIDDEFCVKGKKEIEYLYKKYDVPRDKKLLLYVGNLKPHKNLITLLQALKQLDDDNVCALLIGKAFKSVDLAEQEREMGINNRIIHTGMVSKGDLIDFYNLADLFVFPSLYEGFGIPPLEAMACGTPVIAAKNSSIPEVVGEAAELFDGNDATQLSCKIKELLASEKKQELLIEKGLAQYKHYSWEETREIIRSHINELL